MKTKSLFIILSLAATLLCSNTYAQDWQNRAFYEDATRTLKERNVAKVIFIGDSITQLWMQTHPQFFFDNGFIARGISGQTSSHALLRFREEIVETGAQTAVILIGTNDIARNAGKISLECIAGNIKSMCEIAVSNKVRPVLCSLIPAKRFYWYKGNDVFPDRDIPILNDMLRSYAQKHNITFIDLFTPLADHTPGNENGLPAEYSGDGVHPTAAAYSIMEGLILPALGKESRKIAKQPKPALRLMSYNVRNSIGMDRITNYRRTAAVIADFAPDAVAIQEVDSCTARSNGVYALGQLAKYAGFHATFCPSIDYRGGKYGIGLLSRKAPLSVKRIPLPGREEQRSLLIAEFDGYYYCCTHLSLTAEDRMASLDIIVEEMSKLDSSKDIFIAGDFNAGPGSDFIAGMKKHFDFISNTGTFTFPSDNPDRTIDYIARYKAAGQEFKPKASFVPGAAVASDHRPVVCELDR